MLTHRYEAHITADFRRHKYPFWGADSPASKDVAFADRDSRAPLVAVHNPTRSDFRLKIWLDQPMDRPADFRVNGELFESLKHRGGGFYTGPVNGLSLYRAIKGPPPDTGPDEDELGLPGEYLDACVETIFDEDRRNPWGSWQGDVSGFPGWMHAKSIAITPPITGGNWHAITLKTDVMDDAVEKMQVVRINGVWCIGTPVIDEFDANGQGRFAGTFMYLCDPDDMEEIRSYGDGLTAPKLDNEPIPPRVRYAIFRIRRLVNLPYFDDADWQADLKQLWNGLVGMCAGQGQLDVHLGRMHRYARRAQHYERLVERAWNKAGVDLPMRVWANNQGGDYRKWFDSAEQMNNAKKEAITTAERYMESVARAKRQYEDALARCEEREAQYTDVIPHLYPAGVSV